MLYSKLSSDAARLPKRWLGRRIRSTEKFREGERQLKVLKKDLMRRQPTCQRCRERKTTDYHHIIPRSVAPELLLEPANGMGLCRICHNWVKNFPQEAYKAGFLRHSWEWDKRAWKFRDVQP